MKTSHLALCVIGLAPALVLALVLGVNGGTVASLGLALACPLMMLVIVRMMMGDHQRCPGPN